ncbi:MAG: right-handed parallel beta-helix repeat-containing protein [Verrucomicrobiota bacterium]
MISIRCCFRLGWVCASLIIASCGFATEHFFTPPESPFITAPKETISTLNISAGPVENAQSQINSARQAKADAVLVIHITGKLLVGNTSLILGSRMCLLLEEAGSIAAKPDASAQSLVRIDNAELVSISSAGPNRGVLDGLGRALTGIAVSGSGRVNIDNLSIRGCGVSAITYAGRDAQAVNDAGSVTRCLVQDCGDGLLVTKTAGFMCLDNAFRNNRRTAVSINSPRSIVSGNDSIRNKTGVATTSNHGVITRNTFEDNDSSLNLEAGSTANLVTGNRSLGKTGAVSLSGRNNRIYANAFAASTATMRGGENNLFMNNDGLKIAPSAGGPVIFNPPTSTHPHSNHVIIPGMGRFDLVIPGATNKYQPANLAAARDGLRRARAERPNDVIVLWLRGYYLSHEPAGLELPANTCVILDGVIRADLGLAPDPAFDKKAPLTQVVRLAPEGYCSFSGGTLDGGRQAFHGIVATSAGCALIDGVDIRGAVRDGIHTKGRGAKSPLFINGCSVSANGGRGIWLHVAGDVHALNNVCSGNNQDGIDVDAFATDCTVLFNTSAGNRRHGVFVEEAVTNNIVFANQFLGNNRSGVHVWNEEVPGNTGQNVIAANLCRGNTKGVSVGGRAANRTAGENLLFNNVCLGNRDFGLAPGNSHANGNYFSQSFLHGNGQEIGAYKNTPFIFSQPCDLAQ